MHESGELLMELFISLSFRQDVSLKKDEKAGAHGRCRPAATVTDGHRRSASSEESTRYTLSSTVSVLMKYDTDLPSDG